jgi:hypothetical protein
MAMGKALGAIGTEMKKPLSVSVRTLGKHAGNASVLTGAPSSYLPITRAWGFAPPKEPELMWFAAGKVRRRALRLAGDDSHANPFL